MRVGWLSVVAAVALFGGCAGYRWSSSVPGSMRKAYVPTFRNESNVDELGSVMTRQLARELQREGTFRLVRQDDAAIEIQGTVKNASAASASSDYRSGTRYFEYEMKVEAVVSVIDKVNGKVLIDNRSYTGCVPFVAGDDLRTAKRDASGRIAEDIVRQVMDDVLGYSWKERGNE